MSTVRLDMVGVRARRPVRWSQLKQLIAEWRLRARSRHELTNLNDRILQDIGLSRCTSDFESAKPFWMV